MKQIKIVAIPHGQAPEWVRKAEVGLILTSVDIPENSFFWQTWATGLMDHKHIIEAEHDSYGYNVETLEFIQALEAQSLEAAQWFKDNVDPRVIPWLIFRKNECQLF
jgi:hypothetical protein